jgi:sec-independent protein translocase protein TatB
MFDLAWSELALIAVVAVVVIGPKDLPDAIRNVAKGVQKLRRMASEFQSQADELVREAKLEDVRDQIRDIRNFDLKGVIEKNLDQDGSIRKTFTEDPLKDAWKPETGIAGGTTATTDAAADGSIAAPAGTQADATAAGATPADPAPAATPPAFLPPEVVAQAPSAPASASPVSTPSAPAAALPDTVPPPPVPASRAEASPAAPAPIPPAAETADAAPGKPATPSV